jgi:hypothetical protein
MRRVIGGNGADNTAAAQAWLQNTPNPCIRDLILIGPPESPKSLYMTSHEGPVIYTPYGRFNPAVITRDQVKVKIGLDVEAMALTWTPGTSAQASATANTTTASPYQLAAQHFYDNWPVRILRAFMPTPGDADTLGCADWFGGRVQNCVVGRNKITFNLKSFLDVVAQKVPSTVVEVTNTLASTAAVTLPAGDGSIPVFSCIAPSTGTYIVADCTSPSANKIYPGNLFSGGYMVFLSGAGATLAGAWSAIGQNGRWTDGHGNSHSQFVIFSPLPWPPTPGVDKFYISKTAPINVGEENFYGFPYVPAPTQAV